MVTECLIPMTSVRIPQVLILMHLVVMNSNAIQMGMGLLMMLTIVQILKQDILLTQSVVSMKMQWMKI